MEQVTEYLNFTEEIKYGMDTHLFHHEVPLSPDDEIFIRYLMNHHPNTFLEILEIKQDFQPFRHYVIPFLVNKIAEQILALSQIYPDRHSIDIIHIIRFLCYSTVVSFSEHVDIRELDTMKLSLIVSFQLLEKQIPDSFPSSCCCPWYF